MKLTKSILAIVIALSLVLVPVAFAEDQIDPMNPGPAIPEIPVDPMNPGPVIPEIPIDPMDPGPVVFDERSTLEKAEDLKTFGLFMGSDNGFELENEFTRAEAATMLVRIFHLDVAYNEGALEASFTDVPEDEWYSYYVDIAYKSLMIKGVSDTEFAPEDSVTGAQFATMLLRGIYPEESGDITPETALGFLTTRTAIDVTKAEDLTTKAPFLRGDMVEMLYDVYFLSYAEKVMSTSDVASANIFKFDNLEDGATLDVKVKENQIFQIQVPSNPTTGYQVFYSISNVLSAEYVYNSFNPDFTSELAVGSGGTANFFFKALSKDAGGTAIELVSMRTFDESDKMVMTVNVTVE